MPRSRIVVIGASAGGFEAVTTVLGALPDDFPAAVLVVVHTGPAGILPGALARGSTLPVAVPGDGEPVKPSRVYVPPPDRHLTVQDGVVRLAKGPREHGFRPAIDPLFTSAARAAPGRVAGVILSGALSDGTKTIPASPLEQQVAASEAVRRRRPARPGGRPGAAPSPTRQQAWLSARLHRASRRKSRSAANGRPPHKSSRRS